MEAELVALATSGATTLITLMISDVWAQTKEKLAGILARPGNEDDVLGELEASRADLVDALTRGDGGRTAAIEAEWRARLLRLLLEVPGSADALQSLPAPATGTVYNHISGPVRSAVVVQAGRIDGSTFNAPSDTT
ncbi:hypothetical protein AB0J71_38145 [Nonomuraea sp. NPDC049637]|uniref:hypothetical protein n=1 Tax=Nonomuraea sp. NPDC049637 TaxID=3154356 RepID=UPI00342C663F